MSTTPSLLPTPTLTGMPPEIKQQIIGELDIPDRLRLRNVSKTLRQIGDETPFLIDSLHIALCFDRGFCITVDNFALPHRSDDDNVLARFRYSPLSRSSTDTESIEAVMTFLRALLSIKNIEIKEMHVSDPDPMPTHKSTVDIFPTHLNKLEDLLKSLGHQLKVQNLVLASWEPTSPSLHRQVASLFPHCDPKSIKKIQFNGRGEGNWLNYETVYRSELWKAATSIVMTNEHVEHSDLPHLAHLRNVKTTVVWDHRKPIAESVEGLIQILLQNNDLEQFRVATRYGNYSEELRTHFGAYRTSEVVLNYPNSADKLRFTIYRDYLLFKGPKYVEPVEDVEVIKID